MAELTIHYQAVIEPKIEKDFRYRMMVILARSDRPRYFSFLCHMCGVKVCELYNEDIVAESDLMDMQNTNNLGVGVRCTGRFEGAHCPSWYYFNLNEK